MVVPSNVAQSTAGTAFAMGKSMSVGVTFFLKCIVVIEQLGNGSGSTPQARR